MTRKVSTHSSSLDLKHGFINKHFFQIKNCILNLLVSFHKRTDLRNWTSDYFTEWWIIIQQKKWMSIFSEKYSHSCFHAVSTFVSLPSHITPIAAINTSDGQFWPINRCPTLPRGHFTLRLNWQFCWACNFGWYQVSGLRRKSKIHQSIKHYFLQVLVENLSFC